MFLTKKAIEAIKASINAKRELVYQLGTTYSSLYRWLDSNEKDGKLTTATAISIITEETKLTQKQILTKVKE